MTDTTEDTTKSSGPKIALTKGTLTLGSGLKLNKDDILKKINKSNKPNAFVVKKGSKPTKDEPEETTTDTISADEFRLKSALIQKFDQKTQEEAERAKNAPKPAPRTVSEKPEKKEEKQFQGKTATKRKTPAKDYYEGEGEKNKVKRVKKVTVSNVGFTSELEALDTEEGVGSWSEKSIQGFSEVFSTEGAQGLTEKLRSRFNSTEEDPQEGSQTNADKRDNSIIDGIMEKYRYIEFDKQEEIDKLQEGLALQGALEANRKASQETQEEVSVVTESSFGLKNFEEERRRRRSSRYANRNRSRQPSQESFLQKTIEIDDEVQILELAKLMSVKIEKVLAKFRHFGTVHKETDIIDGDSAELMIEEFGHIALRKKRLTAEDKIRKQSTKTEHYRTIPPVVTIMGHVDHGKTSILDALRSTNVTDREAGGITQHIGAYQITLESQDDQKVTFIDTPGHEAFTEIRSRGSNATHIVVLVVACDDGVKPQTIEAIKHAKSAETPIIVAVNKIDKSTNVKADVERVKAELAGHDVIAENLGGDVIFVPLSAKERTNLDQLLDAILIQADMLEIAAEYQGHASGIVLEGRIEKQKGIVATLLVQNGLLKTGDIVLAGTAYGKIRLMLDYAGEAIETATPSTPAEIYGMNSPSLAGQKFYVVDSEKIAREIVKHREEKIREQSSPVRGVFDLSKEIHAAQQEKNVFNIIVRGDVQGTVDAIVSSIEKIKVPDLDIKVVQSAVGNITEGDIVLAAADSAIIVAFNTKVSQKEVESARKNGVTLKTYNIIYNLLDDVKELIASRLSPVEKTSEIGEVEVRELFSISKAGKIAGCLVRKGIIKRGAFARVLRSEKELGSDYKIKTLKHFKEDIKEIGANNECGVQLEGFEEFQENDRIIIFEKTYETRIV